MNMFPFVLVWVAMAVTVLVLAGVRMISASHENDTIHLHEEEAGVVRQQEAYARKLASLDRWGKTLTVITTLFGLLLAGTYLYQVWMESTKLITS